MLGFKRFETAAVTIRGIELAEKIKKQQFNLKPLTGKATNYIHFRKFAPEPAKDADESKQEVLPEGLDCYDRSPSSGTNV